MKIVVLGGTGLVGRQVVDLLHADGHEAVPASPASGVDAVSGEGLDAALAGADVVIDLTNAPSFDEQTVVAFFTASTAHLLAAEERAGVRLHVALSIVGSDRVPARGYMAGKVAQETLIRDGGIPFTLVKATQFLEFLGGIADAATVDGEVRLTHHLVAPIASAEVARAVADAATSPAVEGAVEVAGPEQAPMDDMVRRYLSAQGDPRTVVSDPGAGYFGIPIKETSLVPVGEARRGTITLEDFLAPRAAA